MEMEMVSIEHRLEIYVNAFAAARELETETLPPDSVVEQLLSQASRRACVLNIEQQVKNR